MPNLNERQFQEPQLFEASEYDVPEPTLDERYEDVMREMASYGVAQVNVHPHAARGILDEGEILSQHYTDGSSGVYDPRKRAALEEEWGIDRPVYGTVQVPRQGELGPTEEAQYGSISIALKRSTRPRTTVTHGDSLDLEGGRPPVPIDDVAEGRAEAPVSELMHTITEDWREGMVKDPTRPPYYEWMEAQIVPAIPDYLGGTRGIESTDFREVHLPMGPYAPEKNTRYVLDQEMMEIGQGFEDIGVPAYLHRVEDRYQPPLPYSDEELEDQGFHRSAYQRMLRRDTSSPSRDMENVDRVDKTYRAKEFRRGTQ